MKHRTTNILCLLLAFLMIFSLAACGKSKGKEADNNLMKLGDYELLYKGASIMEDSDGNDAIVLTLDFTNNSKETASYLWSVSETLIQDGEDLEVAVVFTDDDSFETVIGSQFEDVEPGDTLEIKTAFVLKNTTSKVEATFEEIFGTKNGKITIDPSTLSREEAAEIEPSEGSSDDELLDWWNGSWYGVWKMTGCSDSYSDFANIWMDICGVIDIGADYQGTVTLWDEDYTEDDPMVTAAVSLNEAGTGEHGTMMSEGGWFTDVELEHADWIVDPGLLDYDDMICIDGDYENGDDEFHYEIYLRPWGTTWDDVDSDMQPASYSDWYLPLIEAGKALPSSIGEASADDGNTAAASDPGDKPTGNTSGNVPGGDGLVSEEEVQKGYVWMNEVNNTIFDTTYEELAAYFGVDGKFVKEEYSDHMKANYRYYKWISKEDSSHFIYVNFKEEDSGVYKVSAYNTSGFSGNEAIANYLDAVKAEEAERNKSASANAAMKDFSIVVEPYSHPEQAVKITTKIPESGWSYDESGKKLVESDDPGQFGAAFMRFDVRENIEKFDYYKDKFENYKDLDDKVIGGITFHARSYKNIGYDWIEYIAQIDDNRALSIGLVKMECIEGTMPDIIISNMQIQ
ncbi:MAG: DUF5067 domain-containing protein [Eubacteriales bacterium]|nr:DUF5067 domain-containing protein [Eubacteriales bacterium]